MSWMSWLTWIALVVTWALMAVNARYKRKSIELLRSTVRTQHGVIAALVMNQVVVSVTEQTAKCRTCGHIESSHLDGCFEEVCEIRCPCDGFVSALETS